MLALSRRAVIATSMVAAIAAAVPATLAATSGSQAQPADKAVAAGDSMTPISSATSGAGTTLLTATIKTSKPEDLLLTASLECTILTDITTDNNNMMSKAAAGIRVWIEIDGKIVPIESTSQPPQDGSTPDSGTEADKVTFCDRTYQRTVTDQEGDGKVDETQDYLDTKSAHAFSWVRLNTGSGTHTIVLKADFHQEVAGNANAEAIAGNRTLVVEPTKLANNAVISDTGTG